MSSKLSSRGVSQHIDLKRTTERLIRAFPLKKEQPPEPAPEPTPEVKLLTEIRDLLNGGPLSKTCL